jgi:hypothetical protein
MYHTLIRILAPAVVQLPQKTTLEISEINVAIMIQQTQGSNKEMQRASSISDMIL